MPIFGYKAIDPSGKTLRGTVEASGSKEARGKLKKQGILVVEMSERAVKDPTGGGGIPFFGGRASAKDISLLTRQLASLVKANIPLVDALNALVEQTEKPILKVTLSKVRDDVNEGSSLAKSLALHPKTFDTIFVNMVEAGESSGTLGLILIRLAELKEAQLRLRNKLVSGMTYPTLMMGVAVVMMIVIFTFVIPKLAEVFVSMNKPIPASTKILMTISQLLISYWYLVVAFFFTSLTLFRRAIRSETGRPKWHAFLLKIPVLGPLLRMIAITRFATTMSTLLGTGVPILTGMAISKNLVGNLLIARAIEDARANITEGQSIADPLRRSGEFPPMVIHMIAIGEKTGELPDMLKNIANTYEEQVNARIEQATALLEPIMIIGMGGVVGFIVMSIFIPLLEVSNIQ